MSDGLPSLPDRGLDGEFPPVDTVFLDWGDGSFDPPLSDEGREPDSPAVVPDADPDLGAGFTVALVVVPILAFLFFAVATSAPASWGPPGALAIGGLFSVGYITLCWCGAGVIAVHRR